MKKKDWGLEPKAHKSFIKDRIEFDYLHKLNQHEAAFLSAFNLAVAEGKFGPLETLGYKVSAKLKKELNRERYLADLCTPNSHEAKLQMARKTQTTKFKRNLAEMMLEDLEGEDYEVAMNEVSQICGIIKTESKKCQS